MPNYIDPNEHIQIGGGVDREIDRLRRENLRLRMILKTIARNMPTEEPKEGTPDLLKQAFSIAYKAYTAGILARAECEDPARPDSE